MNGEPSVIKSRQAGLILVACMTVGGVERSVWVSGAGGVDFDAARGEIGKALWTAVGMTEGIDRLDGSTKAASLFLEWNFNRRAARVGKELTPGSRT